MTKQDGFAMRRRKLTLVLCLLFTLLASIACVQDNLLRYGNSYNCDGYFTTARMDEPFFSAHKTIPSSTIASWHQQSHSVVFKDADSFLHIWNQTNPEDLELVGSGSLGLYTHLALANHYNLIAVSRGPGTSSQTFLFKFGEVDPGNQISAIERVSSAVLHPSQLLLAGDYHPGDEDASNLIAVFDLTSDEPVPIATYELKYDIDTVFGWSNNGEIIAVAGDDPKGLIMHYIHTDSGYIEQSRYQDAGSCVVDAVWAPNTQLLAFSGESGAGWDIYLESITNSSENVGYLKNLTNTPEEDERHASWSPSGDRIVYVKTFVDADNHVRQELFIVDINNPGAGPFQLTDTLDEYETGPLWIADDEVIYLSLSVPERGFVLKSISLSSSSHEERTLFIIPEEWNQ